MTGSTKKPAEVAKVPRKRTTSLVVVKCDIANCSFSAKTTKTVQKHQREVHELSKPHNDTTFNQSVSCSLLDATDTTVDPGEADSLEHKTSTEIYHEMTKVQQSTQLASTGKKRMTRDSDGEEEDEEDKRRKLESAVVPELTQTQGEKERQEVRDRALATVSRKLQEGALNESRSLLEESSEKPEFHDDASHEGDSMLLHTARETIPVDSLSLSSFQVNEENTEIKSLEDKLKASDDSLKQALAKIAKLEEGEGTKIRTIEFLENKISKKDKEIKDSTETIHALTDQVDKVDPKNTKRNTALNNKVTALEKKLADAKVEAARYKENAETQRQITEGFKLVQADLTAQIASLKRDTLCREENCTNRKECGRSHAQKEENRAQCDFFNFGRCKKGNECRYKHDLAAKAAYHETEGKKKKEESEREEERKEEEKRKKKVEEVNRKEEEEEKKLKGTKEEKKKEKLKRKRMNRKLRKTGDSTVSSAGMEVDEDSTEEIPQPASKKKKNSKKPGGNNTNATNDQGKPKAPTSALARPQTSLQPGVSQPPTALHPDLSRPPPSFGPFQPSGHQIPPSFEFNQVSSIHNIPPCFTPNLLPSVPQRNIQPPVVGTFSGAQGWSAQGWQGPGQVEPERRRHEEMIQAQSLTRRARLDNIRSEIAYLQSRIFASQSQPRGTIDIQALMNQEAALKQLLFEQSY